MCKRIYVRSIITALIIKHAGYTGSLMWKDSKIYNTNKIEENKKNKNTLSTYDYDVDVS